MLKDKFLTMQFEKISESKYVCQILQQTIYKKYKVLYQDDNIKISSDGCIENLGSIFCTRGCIKKRDNDIITISEGQYASLIKALVEIKNAK